MNQEISISYRAVRREVCKLSAGLGEGEKREGEVQESIRRWWKMVRPDDRAVAEKYLAMVPNRPNASLLAIRDGVPSYEPFELGHHSGARVGNRQPAA